MTSTLACAQTPGFAEAQSTENLKGDDNFPISKQMLHSIEFGIGAGTLVGIAAISNFHKNIAQNLDTQNIFRGMSWGLYGGIILGIYAELVSSKRPATDSDAPATPGPSDTQTTPLSRQFLLATDSNFDIEPVFIEGQLTGGFVRLQLLRF